MQPSPGAVVMPEPPTPIIHPTATRADRFGRANGVPETPERKNGSGPPGRKPKLKKLRLALVLTGLSALAVVSTVFGMLMAVASDLPSLENRAQYRSAQNSVLFADSWGCKEFEKDRDCQQIAKLTGNQNRILVRGAEISPNVKNAVIAVEDRRFYGHEGVDYTGIARALVQDVLQRRAAQGGSTITQQFVKNALDAQGNRSVFQKLRESALAYHLERQWPKDKILTQYLNSVYFGNGAYGIEAAVRTYFGDGDEPEERAGADDAGVSYTPPVVEEQQDPNAREAIDVAPHEAALLAGMIASPSMYDPIANKKTALARRNLVLQRMREMGTITEPQYQDAIRQSLPAEDDVDPPNTESQQPYFTTWMTEHLLEQYRPGRVFAGGLKVRTTIDPELQQAAESAIVGRLAGVGPDASLVAIKNDTGEVRAMVGGSDFNARPFNLATNGHRQPGSAFKPFILVRALEDGIDPNSVWASQPKELPFEGEKGPELFKVSNYEDSYLGSASLWSATATSDNSVFAELGMEVKPKRVARLAQRMGIRTELSTNPAMLLGGLTEGVTPLEMAYAYSTIANDGVRVSGSLAPNETGPVAIQSVEERNGKVVENDTRKERVFPGQVGQVAKDMLSLVVTSGTGKAAQVGDEFIWGKTGTTENYGDAWFVGGNDDITVAIWVGYADKVQPMEYEHAGGPVAGGTYPAEIFQDFMSSWLELRQSRRLERGLKNDDGTDETAPVVPISPTDVPPAEQVEPTEPETGDGGGTGGDGGDAAPQPAPQEPAPAPEPVPTPAPPTTPPTDGGGGGGGVSPGAAE
ncbi:MAG TPA: transglycosylase domain-containing protein [Thermoleophilaceae bacterium]|nr:transglycosylase domain-containing protein [Thermoleophilaceae bacterium]